LHVGVRRQGNDGVDTSGELRAARNIFRGIAIDPDSLASDPAHFAAQLRASMKGWRAEGVRVVWLEVPIRLAALIPVAVQAGFVFHHADPEGATMTCALDSEAVIPLPATHYIGAGGLVLNEAGELLVIVEKAHRHHRPNYYKLPGGALRPGEHLVDGVIREVREETSIETRFEALMGFRHWHGYRFGKSDIYFICRLAPLSQEITIQESEISAGMWMPLDSYLADPNVGLFNKRMVEAGTRGDGLVPGWFEGYEVTHETHEIFVPGGSW
jgi:8-oxo-dGTP diphosphatase